MTKDVLDTLGSRRAFETLGAPEKGRQRPGATQPAAHRPYRAVSLHSNLLRWEWLPCYFADGKQRLREVKLPLKVTQPGKKGWRTPL